jgi:hypothetical protein
VIDNDAVALIAGASASLTRTVNDDVPGTSGVPEITPPLPKLKPNGNAPDSSDHEYGVTPPDAASAAEYAEPSDASGNALVVTTSGDVFTVVDAVERLLPATGSSVVADTSAVLLNVPADPGVTTIFTVAPAPFASVPRLHVTVAVPLHEPTVVLDETNVTPDGS